MRHCKFFTVVVLFVALFFSFAFTAGADEELAGYVGDYTLADNSCPGGISGSINVGIYNGIGIVKTSLGYLFSINAAGGSVIIKNGPTTICTGTMNGNTFSGSCLDHNRNFCAVTYQKTQ